MPTSENKVVKTYISNQLNKNCRIISRASDESSSKKLKIAGAANVIMPDKLGGAHMASLVVTPDVLEFVDQLTIEGETTANLEEILVNDLPKEYLEKTILDLDLRKKTGCTVIGVKASEGNYIINPEASIKLILNSINWKPKDCPQKITSPITSHMPNRNIGKRPASIGVISDGE